VAVPAAKNNSARTWLRIGVPLVSGLIVWEAYNSIQAHQHEMRFGHMGMEERVKGIEDDVAQLPEMKDSITMIQSDMRLVLHKLEELERSP